MLLTRPRVNEWNSSNMFLCYNGRSLNKTLLYIHFYCIWKISENSKLSQIANSRRALCLSSLLPLFLHLFLFFSFWKQRCTPVQFVTQLPNMCVCVCVCVCVCRGWMLLAGHSSWIGERVIFANLPIRCWRKSQSGLHQTHKHTLEWVLKWSTFWCWIPQIIANTSVYLWVEASSVHMRLSTSELELKVCSTHSIPLCLWII